MPEARDLLTQTLAEEDVCVRTAENGLEALKIMEDSPADLILFYLMMPEVLIK